MALNSLNNSNSNNINATGSNDIWPADFSKKVLLVMIIVLVITIVIFLCVMIYISIVYPSTVEVSDKNEEVLLNFIHDCKNNPLDISTKAISASTSGNEYSLTFWVFINNLDTQYLDNPEYHHLDILSKGPIENGIIDTNLEMPIKVFLENKSSTLRISMKKEGGSSDIMSGKEGCYSNIIDAPADQQSTYNKNLDKMDILGDSLNNYDDCKIAGNSINNSYFGILNQDCYYLDSAKIDMLNTDIAQGRVAKMPQNIGIEECNNSVPSPSEYMYVKSVGETESIKPCRISNFPIQRWNCITLNVHNNIVDLFFDGKLLHTCVYDGNLELNNDPIIIGNRGGFDGYVSNVVWSNKALIAGEIYERYARGPRIRLTMSDRIKFMFMKKPKQVQDSLDQAEYVESQGNKGRV